MSSSRKVPSLENTYFSGASFQLYRCPPPDRPVVDAICPYGKDVMPMTQIADRLAASIARRAPILSDVPNVSITLDERFVSSIRRIPHVWTTHVQAQDSSTSPNSDVGYPSTLVGKRYDPVSFDPGEAEYVDPFALLVSVWQETEAYLRLGPLQGVKVPRFYGHAVAPLGCAHGNRTVNVVLLEYIHGRTAEAFKCSSHKNALIDESLRFNFDILALGVVQ